MSKVLRNIWLVIVGSVPWIIKGIGFLIRLMALGAVSILQGVPQSTDQIARDWIKETKSGSRNSNLLSEYEKYVYWAIRTLAFVFVLLGWICLAFTTVFLVMLLF
jgi:hypothetical protein